MHRSKAAKVYFQTENEGAFETLLQLVKQNMPLDNNMEAKAKAVKQHMKDIQQQGEKGKSADKSSFNVCNSWCIWSFFCLYLPLFFIITV